MINKNLENNEEFNIPLDFYKNRTHGLSAMVRVGDEEEFIRPSIESVLDFFDEIVIILNNPRDNTEEMVRQINSEKIKIYYYPHQLFPNGPGHDKYPKDSLKEISYYYNWCLSKTTKTHVCKWDGDMVALPNFQELRTRALESDILFFEGLNITGADLNILSKIKKVATSEPRIFKVTENTFYVQGPACELFSCKDENPKVIKVKNPVYLHYKHAKNIMSQTKVWPEDWIKQKHFLKIYKRKDLGEPYTGTQPKSIIKYFPEKFQKEGFVFIHIPKTAGQSIKKVIYGKTGGPHQPIMQVPNRQNLFSFSIIRNPWDRLYSAFCYLSSDGCGNEQDKRLNKLYFKKYNKDFKSFVISGLNRALVREVIHLRPQNYFLCDNRGKIMVDFVGRYENLREDLSKILSKIGMPEKLADLSISNGSKRQKNYMKIYNEEMVKKVADIYRKDIEIFDYRFEKE